MEVRELGTVSTTNRGKQFDQKTSVDLRGKHFLDRRLPKPKGGQGQGGSSAWCLRTPASAGDTKETQHEGGVLVLDEGGEAMPRWILYQVNIERYPAAELSAAIKILVSL